MIFICHVDPKRPDCVKQAELCKKSFDWVKQEGKFVTLVRGYDEKQYAYYGLDKSYPVYNRHIAILEYIEKYKLFDQNIVVLDPDMFFMKPITINRLNSQDFYGTDWCLDNQHYLSLVKKKFIDVGYDVKSYSSFAAPYYSLGSNVCELSRLILKADKHTRDILQNTSELWVSEMYTQSYMLSLLGLNFHKTPVSAYCVWNYNESQLNDLSIFHYPWGVFAKNGGRIKKWILHDLNQMKNDINNFGEPVDPYSKIMIEFYRKAYLS
jgi:hypothetical protein